MNYSSNRNLLIKETTLYSTHICRNLDCVFSELLCLLHHSCREISHDAHLVHIAVTVHLPRKITWPFLTNVQTPYYTRFDLGCYFKCKLISCTKNKYLRLQWLHIPEAFVTDCTYASRPEDSGALLWYEFRIHINHLTLLNVDESAVRS